MHQFFFLWMELDLFILLISYSSFLFIITSFKQFFILNIIIFIFFIRFFLSCRLNQCFYDIFLLCNLQSKNSNLLIFPLNILFFFFFLTRTKNRMVFRTENEKNVRLKIDRNFFWRMWRRSLESRGERRFFFNFPCSIIHFIIIMCCG